MRLTLLAGLFGLVASAASAIPPIIDQPPPAPPPRLLVLLSVEGLTTEMLDRHRDQFRGGLARLSGGVAFRNLQSVPEAAPSIGDLIQSKKPTSVTVAVGGDQASALRVGGSAPDQRWFWSTTRFVTDLSSPAPQVVGQANAAIQAMIATAQPPLVPPPGCGSATPLPGARFERAAGTHAAFSQSPAIDGALLAMSAALVKGLGLGSDINPDLVAISLPATARVAERFGPASASSCMQLLSLDRDIGGFLDLLDRSGLDYSVTLIGGGAGPSPALFWRRGMTGAARSEAISKADVTSTLATQLGFDRGSADRSGRCLAGIGGIACPQR